ncbi:MAG: UDP-2,3-diacylglucosamine diphosphatase [Legionella sp.]|nr:UDP-2,3-diacylglucosamine diphosphatase [Legionella sp.]
MIDVVFISDLHLHPEDKEIQNRFNAFIEWAKVSTKEVYILGDFFHAWAGDDSLDQWSSEVAQQIRDLVDLGINVYYMHGNRDFLLGSGFANRAGWKILKEPKIIQLGSEPVLLVHGDGYCTNDISHQRFRRLTRNKLFITLFLALPLGYRQKLVNNVRSRSMNDKTKSTEEMNVVDSAVLKDMNRKKVTTLIHGHTHLPGLTKYTHKNQELRRYVLSDWDDTPQLLCYDNTKGLYFTHI